MGACPAPVAVGFFLSCLITLPRFNPLSETWRGGLKFFVTYITDYASVYLIYFG